MALAVELQFPVNALTQDQTSINHLIERAASGDTAAFEKIMIDEGIIVIKYWLEVSMEEQTRRLETRIHDARKTWKLSPMDLESYRRWYDYSRARDEMFQATTPRGRRGTWSTPTTRGARA